MFALSPSQTLVFTLISAAILALVFSLSIGKKHKIPNPMFSLARALASFVATWLIWGNLTSTGNATSASTQIGLIPYLRINYTRPSEQWLAQLSLDWGALSLTIALTGLALLALSVVLGHLAAISDRRR